MSITCIRQTKSESEIYIYFCRKRKISNKLFVYSVITGQSSLKRYFFIMDRKLLFFRIIKIKNAFIWLLKAALKLYQKLNKKKVYILQEKSRCNFFSLSLGEGEILIYLWYWEASNKIGQLYISIANKGIEEGGGSGVFVGKGDSSFLH